MRWNRYEDESAPGRTIVARLHKNVLAEQHKIHCGHCRYHRRENRTHTSPHADIRKRHVEWKRFRSTMLRLDAFATIWYNALAIREDKFR